MEECSRWNQHALHTEAGPRFQGLQNHGQSIGNRDFETASLCVYHLAVQVFSRSASLFIDRFGSFYRGRYDELAVRMRNVANISY